MEFTYIIKKSRRRSLCVQIVDGKTVLVKAPFGTSEKTVQEFLISRKQWIIKHLNKAEQNQTAASEQGFLSEDEIKRIKKQARKIIPQRVEYFAGISGISYNRIFIRLQSSRWGSCSADGNLNFNCLLVLMPPQILDSVVIHELCHRRYMNHSSAFYAEIDKYFPNYKQCEKWLKQNGDIYLRRAGKR